MGSDEEKIVNVRIDALVIDKDGYICRTYSDHIERLKFLRKEAAKTYLSSIWASLSSIERVSERCIGDSSGWHLRLTDAGVLLAGSSPLEERKSFDIFYYHKKEYDLN